MHNGQFHGNPMRDSRVKDYRAGVNRLLNRSHVAKSSLPMTYSGMKKVMAWLDDDSSSTSLGQATRLELGALFSIAWVCMLRMDEALNIKLEDIKQDRTEIRAGITYNYHEIVIRNRKTDIGNTKKNSSRLIIVDPNAAKPYGLFDLPEEPHIRPYTRMRRWLSLLTGSGQQADHGFARIDNQAIKKEPCKKQPTFLTLSKLLLKKSIWKHLPIRTTRLTVFDEAGPNTDSSTPKTDGP
jgi:hypothetical protein